MPLKEAPSPWLNIHRELDASYLPESDKTLAQHVAAKADEIPDNTALVFLRREITFREVEEEASKIAHGLVGLGVGKDDVIGLFMPNIPQFVFSLIAASKIGAKVSAVSPLLAPPEIVYQIEDAGITVMVGLDALVARAFSEAQPPARLKTVIVTGAADFLNPAAARDVPTFSGADTQHYLGLIDGVASDFEPASQSIDDVFLYQYTGGTTGRAKGAMLTMRVMINNGLQATVFLPMEENTECVASAAPFFHIAGMGCLTYGLRIGAKQSLIPDPRNIEDFCQFMIDHPPTRMNGAPALYQMMAEHPMSAEIDFSKLDSAIVGAAPLTSAGRVAIEARIGEGKLGDVFGMTETGPIYLANPAAKLKPDTVGIPLPGMDVMIVDVETGEKPLPIGEAGEIIVSSPHNMLGYLNMPEETRNALRQHGDRIYMHTGDVGFFDEEGYVHLCDRAKDMLVVGGFKVFSVEVEDKLAALDCVMRSAVIGAPDEKRPGNDIVNLFVELTEEAKTRDQREVEAQIMTFFKENMAPYKAPKQIHIIDLVPMTPVGKIDKKALRARLLV